MTTYDTFVASAAENYERDFVPAIGTPVAERLLDSARLEPGERVLDVACGTGIVARLALDAVAPNGTVTGLDATPDMLEVARRKNPGVEWHHAPAERMPLADENFDVVVCSLGLMFFEDKVGALREMRRVLAPGGRVVIGTPGPTPPLFEAIETSLSEHVGPAASMFVRVVFSLHEASQVHGLLEEAGFADIEIERTTVPLRVAAPAPFFWQYVHSTPLISVIGSLDADARARLERDVVERCRPFVVNGGAEMEPGLLLAVGRRPRA
jgi:ubiquinone/menaquinone biosynthesis C-methylase UbiE